MIVGMVPTFREGPLAAAAIRSLLPCCKVVITFEGPVGNAPQVGDPTDLQELRKLPFIVQKAGAWTSEVEKRNAMLEFTRRYAPPVWGVYLDADEVLIDGQWVPDLIYAAEQQTQDAGNSTAAIPLAISEIDASVGRVHRIIRLDLLERHVLSMSQWKFFSSEIIAVFPVVPVWRPGDPIAADDIDGYRGPIISGTPHIHHRAYYRPPVRSEFRLHQAEMEEAGEIERAALDKLGIISDAPGQIPINQDQGLIVATDTGKISVPSMLDELRKGDRQ